MRLLHTSDWHLGHMLRGEVSREHEHAAFLRWLLDACIREASDVLLITGDVFDSATPTAASERMWFDFLAAARRARPAMDIVAIAGNHDSPARLGASSSILRELGVHVVGSLPRDAASGDNAANAASGGNAGNAASGGNDGFLIPVAGGRGLIAAIPFLRPADLLDRDLEAIYADAIAAARARRRPDQALIVTGHLYVAGADVQYLSERRVSIGGQESASLRLFPDDIDYVALGHIHRAQRVGRDTIRYAGAPLALSLDEAHYHHQVLAIDFAAGRVADIRSLPIPRTVEIVRVPRRGAAPLHEVLAELDLLPLAASAGGAVPESPARPYLEVVVALDRPQPRLRALVEAALEHKHARLVYLHVEHTGDRAALGDLGTTRSLADHDPRDVFLRLWARDHATPPDAAILDAFDRLLEQVRGDREDLA